MEIKFPDFGLTLTVEEIKQIVYSNLIKKAVDNHKSIAFDSQKKFDSYKNKQRLAKK